jgi:S1-C subfamily serine protease
MTRYKALVLLGLQFFAGAYATASYGATHVGLIDKTPSIENSVVKVFSTMRYPDPFKPWTKQAPSEATASGVVIEGNRILTNAHAVLYASQVQVQANAAGDKVSATVVAIAPGIDLAVLKLDDPRASSRASSSSPTTIRCRDCAFRSTRPSIPATAAAPRSPTTR